MRKEIIFTAITCLLLGMWLQRFHDAWGLPQAQAAEPAKAAPALQKADDVDVVLDAKYWHRAVFDKMEFVVYTGPGQAMLHHWVEIPPPPKARPRATPKPPVKADPAKAAPKDSSK